MSDQLDFKELCIPVYHGTSCLFLNDIKTNGLGGSSPFSHSKALSLLKDLYEISIASYSHDFFSLSKNGLIECFIENIIEQRASNGSNWQHGDVVYVDCSLGSVKNHLRANPLGSELLSYSHKIVKALLLKNPDFNFPTNISSHLLFPLINTTDYQQQIIFKIKNLSSKDLLDENGCGIEEKLNWLIDELKEDGGYERLNGIYPYSFRLIRVIPYDQLELVSI